MFSVKDLIGIPFKDGGRDIKSGFDCYGLAVAVYKKAGIEIPEYYAPAFDDIAVNNQIEKVKSVEWEQIDRNELTVPTLVLFSFNSHLCNHVGVYIGNGLFIHCRNPIGVNIDRIDSPAWRHRIRAFYRLKGEGNNE